MKLSKSFLPPLSCTAPSRDLSLREWITKALQHKYIRKFRGKNGKWVYVYAEGDRHGKHAISGTKLDVAKHHLHEGASFSAGSGKGHLVVQSQKGNKVTFYHDDVDGKGNKGEPQTVSLKEFKEMVVGHHKEAAIQHARTGFDKRLNFLQKAMQHGTDKHKKRAAIELHRFMKLHKDRIPEMWGIRVNAMKSLFGIARKHGLEKEDLRKMLGVDSLSEEATTEKINELANDLRTMSKEEAIKKWQEAGAAARRGTGKGDEKKSKKSPKKAEKEAPKAPKKTEESKASPGRQLFDKFVKEKLRSDKVQLHRLTWTMGRLLKERISGQIGDGALRQILSERLGGENQGALEPSELSSLVTHILEDPAGKLAEFKKLEADTEADFEAHLADQKALAEKERAEKRKNYYASRKKIAVEAKDKKEGWRDFYEAGVSFQKDSGQAFIEKNKEKIQALWDKYRVPVLPHSLESSIPQHAFDSLMSQLDDLNEAFDVKDAITNSGITFSFSPDLADIRGHGGGIVGGEYSPGEHFIRLVDPSHSGSVFVHEFFHALDFSKGYEAGKQGPLSNPGAGDSDTSSFLKNTLPEHRISGLTGAEADEFKAYQDAPEERLARMMEDFVHPITGSRGVRDVDDRGEPTPVTGYWGHEVMAKHADQISAIAEKMGVKFKPEYIERVKRGDQSKNVQDKLSAHKEKQEIKAKQEAEHKAKEKERRDKIANFKDHPFETMEKKEKSALLQSMKEDVDDVLRAWSKAGRPQKWANQIFDHVNAIQDAQFGFSSSDPRENHAEVMKLKDKFESMKGSK